MERVIRLLKLSVSMRVNLWTTPQAIGRQYTQTGLSKHCRTWIRTVSTEASLTTARGSNAQASPNSGVSRHQSASRPTSSVAGSACQAALPSTSASRPTSAAPPVANANVGIAGPMAVPSQQHMNVPTAMSMQARSAGATDARGNTLYVQQVLQQIQHNPDPRLI